MYGRGWGVDLVCDIAGVRRKRGQGVEGWGIVKGGKRASKPNHKAVLGEESWDAET